MLFLLNAVAITYSEALEVFTGLPIPATSTKCKTPDPNLVTSGPRTSIQARVFWSTMTKPKQPAIFAGLDPSESTRKKLGDDS